jgi:hypothetical protein
MDAGTPTINYFNWVEAFLLSSPKAHPCKCIELFILAASNGHCSPPNMPCTVLGYAAVAVFVAADAPPDNGWRVERD